VQIVQYEPSHEDLPANRVAREVVAAYQRLADWKQTKGFPTPWT